MIGNKLRKNRMGSPSADGTSSTVEGLSFSPRVSDSAQEEADALARCRAGDREAFRVLVALHEKAITSAVSRIVLYPQETEDLVQETFIQAYCKLSSFRGDSSFGTWVYRIAVNLSLRRVQQLRKKGWTPLDALEGWEPADLRSEALQPERETVRADDRRQLQEALLGLSDVHRTVVTLHYFEEKSCPEIAEIMDCSVGTVWSRLHYALKKLKSHLSMKDL